MQKYLIKNVLLVIVCLLVCGCSDNSSKQEDNRLQGEWRSERGTTFIFDDKEYGYYKDGDDKEDNYYKGSYTFKVGQDAMADDQLGISENEFVSLQKTQKIDKDDIYAVKMNIDMLFSEGRDKTDEIEKGGYYFFAFYFTSENSIHVVNMATLEEFIVTKVK